MSMHTQLLRGVVVLPVLLLLAVASVAAPAPREHAVVRTHAHAATVVIVADDGVVMVRSVR